MKTKRYILLLSALLGMALHLSSQTDERSSIGNRAIGHMAVTIVSTAAVSSMQNMEFNDIAVASTASSINSGNKVLTRSSASNMAAFKVVNTNATYSVTISSKSVQINRNNTKMTVSDFTTSISDNENVYIGGSLHIGGKIAPTAITSHSNLEVAINYN